MSEPPGPQTPEAPAVPEAAIAAGPPDWDSLVEQIKCPMCRYSLRGLVEPRCPECGYRFTWPDMLDRRRRLHPYVFEHHPEKNLRSFLRTALAGWRPRRFWTALHPFQPSRPARLVRYWMYAIAVYALSLILSALATAIVIANTNRIYNSRAQSIQSGSAPVPARYPDARRRHGPPPLPQWAFQMNPTSIPVILRDKLGRPHQRDGFCVTLVLPIAWPWLTFVTLMIFPFTMRRVGVRPVHALRCVLYSMDTPFWIGVLIIAISAGQAAAAVFSGAPYEPIEFLNSWGVVILLMVLVGCWRLWRAYKFYMQFDHALATVLVAQFIVFLVVMIAFALLIPAM
jgi:hypothetical protein